MFEHWRRTWGAYADGSASPEARRAAAADMKTTLVHARVSVDAMRVSLTEIRGRCDGERRELETVRRRLVLAQGIGDAETVRVATHFEQQHAERVAVLTRKVEAQEAELALAEREVAEMAEELRRVMGVGAGSTGAGTGAPTASPAGPSPEHSARNAAELDAEVRLAALKRRMGK